MQPVIKWSGSKRSQIKYILPYIVDYDVYYEPFVGGGSVMYNVSGKRICSDICKPLIDLWLLIQNDPNSLIINYRNHWNNLQKQGQNYYYLIRDNFNKNQSPYDFFFLSRTCTNGLIRFNSKGEFNNSFHHNRNGINPDTLKVIVYDWSKNIQTVKFINQDYKEILQTVTDKDIVYLDPPYFNTKGMYYGTINYNDFYAFLEQLNRKGIRWLLSFDGIRGNDDYTVNIPQDLYKEHLYIKSGKSSFNKLQLNNKEVYESLYMNFIHKDNSLF